MLCGERRRRFGNSPTAIRRGVAALLWDDGGGHHWMTTAPAMTKPSSNGSRIGGTSHSRRSNFWVLDMLTAALRRERKLSSPADARHER